MPGVWPVLLQKAAKYTATTISQPPPASAPPEHAGARRSRQPGDERDGRTEDEERELREQRVDDERDPARDDPAEPGRPRPLGSESRIGPPGARAHRLGELAAEAGRLRDERAAHLRARQRLLERALERGHRDHPLDRQLQRVTAGLRAGIGGLEDLVDHPVDDAVTDDRTCDSLGQRAGEQPVDHALRLVGERAAEGCGAESHELNRTSAAGTRSHANWMMPPPRSRHELLLVAEKQKLSRRRSHRRLGADRSWRPCSRWSW